MDRPKQTDAALILEQLPSPAITDFRFDEMKCLYAFCYDFFH